MILCVYVDVPVADLELFGLLRRQCRLSLIELATGLPRWVSQMTTGPFLPRGAGPWKCAIVTGPETRYR